MNNELKINELKIRKRLLETRNTNNTKIINKINRQLKKLEI